MDDIEVQNIKPVEIEVWVTKSHIILKKTSDTLWYSRENGSLLIGSDLSIPVYGIPTKLCSSCGLIGKIQFMPDSEWYLLLIKESKFVGVLPPTDGSVYCIESVILVPLSVEKSIAEIKMETYINDRREKDIKDKGKLERKLKEALHQMFGSSQSFYFSYDVDLTQSLQRKNDCGDANRLRKWQQVDERFFWNRSMLDDLLENETFGYKIDSWVIPIIQGYIEIKQVPIPSRNHFGVFEKDKPGTESLGTSKEMLLESSASTTVDTTLVDTSLLDSNQDKYLSVSTSTPQTSPCSSIHSSLAIEQSNEAYPSQNKPIYTDNVPFNTMNERFEGIPSEDSSDTQKDNNLPMDQLHIEDTVDEGLPLITIALISRRSRYRAGTRYLRRGVDNEGHVANYVETEMILQVSSHVISFMIVRGSVPVYWTQPGHKYRPTPIIQQSDAETAYAFERHFEAQINLYSEQILVNLINQSGREKILSTAYEKNLIKLDCPSLSYVAFDFHHHCKLNQWHNINLLLDNVEEYINRQKYFWVDLSYEKGPLCIQQGVFRVNCMDCLDRTNVVQSVLCKEVIQIALQKLGLLSPFGVISGQFLQHYQSLWANNGDTISRQYTGTAAMKGDLTRYGQRRLYGVMRDGYNSAHRYLQSVFRDAYRQVVIDLQQGIPPQDALACLSQSQKGWEEEQVFKPPTFSDLPSWSSEREQAITDMISVCRDTLYPNINVYVKGWALIEPAGYSFVTTSEKEEETVLLLCQERRHVCIANYNSDFEQVACCIRIPLERIERICIGHIGTILRSSRRLYMRLHYTLFPGCSCYFTFRSVHSLSLEEDKLTLLSIAEELVAIQPTIAIQEQKLSKKQSQPHEGIVFLIAPSEWAKDDWETILVPRTKEDDSIRRETNSYEQLSSNSSSTPTRYHSRQSSNTSGIVALVNFNDQNEKNLGEVETDSSVDEDNEISFSVPTSPNLIRRTDMMSLKERSKLFSHSSLEDLKAVVSGESSSSHSKKRSHSFGLVILESNSSETDDEENVNIDDILSTTRLYTQHPKNTTDDDDDDVFHMRPRIPSPDVVKGIHVPVFKVKSTTTLSQTSPKREILKQLSDNHLDVMNESKTVVPIVSSVQGTISSESTQELSDSNSSITKSGSSGYLSRLKFGKLFQKSKTSSNEKGEPQASSSEIMKNNVIQAIGILKGLKAKSELQDLEQDPTSTNEEANEEQWIRNAMKHSKTRFIII